MKNRIFAICLLLATCFGAAWAQVSVKQVVGWYESAYVTWELYQGADMYNVYVKGASDTNWKQLDEDLIRNYGWYGRADAVGLKPGNYQFKIEATKSGSVISGSATETKTVSVQAYDRDGFAHKDGVAVGAYNNDGTLKDNARVLYINNDNVDNVQLAVLNAKTETTCTGLGEILKAYEKGLETRPLAVRIIGNINTTSGQLYGDADAMQLKGKNNTIPMQVTIEGVGDDAWLSDWGFVFVKANNVEMRNLGIALFNDDGISIKESVKMWVHHCDIFYGKAGSASDQAKGDGSLDVKDDSQYCTFSYVHFWDSGKMSLCGMKSESGPNYMSYHHNWFDHSDSRHPRIRTMTVHIYNNYYYGSTGTNMSLRASAYAFIENCYFDNAKNPIVSETDATYGSGYAKIYGCIFVGHEIDDKYSDYLTVVTDREQTVFSTTKFGQNFDTDSAIFYYDETNNRSDVENMLTAEEVRTLVPVLAGVMSRSGDTGGDVGGTTTPDEGEGGGTTTPDEGEGGGQTTPPQQGESGDEVQISAETAQAYATGDVMATLSVGGSEIAVITAACDFTDKSTHCQAGGGSRAVIFNIELEEGYEYTITLKVGSSGSPRTLTLIASGGSEQGTQNSGEDTTFLDCVWQNLAAGT